MAFNSAFNWFIRKRMAQISAVRNQPVEMQRSLFAQLMANGAQTVFGQDHGLGKVKTLRQFQSQVPIRSYDEFKRYIHRAHEGESHVLWPGTKRALGVAHRQKMCPEQRLQYRRKVWHSHDPPARKRDRERGIGRLSAWHFNLPL